MNPLRACAIALPLAAGLAAGAWACGVCVEDKVAATYDHALVREAAAKGRVVVFCALEAGVTADEDRAGLERELKRLAAGVRGVDARTVRTSTAPPAFSFVLDPRVQAVPAAVAAWQKRLAPSGKVVGLLKVLPESAARVTP